MMSIGILVMAGLEICKSRIGSFEKYRSIINIKLSKLKYEILSATELGAGDGGGDGDIEALGRFARGVVVGDE